MTFPQTAATFVAAEKSFADPAPAEHVSEVEREIEESGTKVTLDLEEVTLVDVQVVRFLGTCEIRDISILNCSPYITDWIAKERR